MNSLLYDGLFNYALNLKLSKFQQQTRIFYLKNELQNELCNGKDVENKW